MGAQGQQYESLLLSCMLKFLAVMQCQKIVIIFPNVIGYSQMVFSDTIYNIKKIIIKCHKTIIIVLT